MAAKSTEQRLRRKAGRLLDGITTQLLAIYIFKAIAADDGTAVQAVNDECGEIAYIKALASSYEAKQRSAADAVVTLAGELRVMQLAATQGQGTIDGAKYALLTTVAAEELSKALGENSRQAEGVLPEARAELMRRLGHVEALRHINAATGVEFKKAQQAAAGATGNEGGAGISVDVDLQLKTTAVQPCQADRPGAEHIKSIGKQVSTDTNYKGVPDEAFLPPLTQLKLAAKGCTHASANTCTTKRGCADGADYSGSHFLAVGTATSGKQNTLKATQQPFETGSACIEPDRKGSTKDTINRARTASAICKARKQPTSRHSSIKQKTVKSIAHDSNYQKLALAALGETPKPGASEQGKNAVKKLLGNDESTTLDKFFTELENKDLQLSQDKSASKTSIKAAAEGDEYGLALAYITGQALKRTEQSPKQIPEADTTDKDCTAKGKMVVTAKNANSKVKNVFKKRERKRKKRKSRNM